MRTFEGEHPDEGEHPEIDYPGPGSFRIIGADGKHPEIDYPCPWSYRIIGTDEGALRRAVVDILGDAEYRLDPANRSSGGAYCSLELELVVKDEAHRLRVFAEIAQHPDVRFVL